MSDKIILYKTFYHPIEANIIRAKLEDNGYHCFLRDENLSTLQPFYNQAIGGVKLMVFERDIPEIDALLLEQMDGEEAQNQFEKHVDFVESEVKCENCGSGNVAYGYGIKGKYAWWAIIISIVLTVYPIKVKKCYHCFDCDHEFQ